MRFSFPPHFQSLKAIENGDASVRRGNSELIRVSSRASFDRSDCDLQTVSYGLAPRKYNKTPHRGNSMKFQQSGKELKRKRISVPRRASSCVCTRDPGVIQAGELPYKSKIFGYYLSELRIIPGRNSQSTTKMSHCLCFFNCHRRSQMVTHRCAE
jgi:hypothetical protein